METRKQVLITTLCFVLVSTTLFCQNEFTFGTEKIKIAGSEVCNYTINKNSHFAKDYLDIKNGILLYTAVEFEDGKPIHIEMTECKLTDLDKKNCSLGASDQKSIYTPGQIYVLYLYTLKDQVSISTTIYESPNSAATVQSSSMGRIHFRDHQIAENYFSQYFK